MCIGTMQRVCVVVIVEWFSVCDWCDSGAATDDQSAITSANSISKRLGSSLWLSSHDWSRHNTQHMHPCALTSSESYFLLHRGNKRRQQASFSHDLPYSSKMKGREMSSLVNSNGVKKKISRYIIRCLKNKKCENERTNVPGPQSDLKKAETGGADLWVLKRREC